MPTEIANSGEDDTAQGSGGHRASDRTLVETRVSRITIHESRLEIVFMNGSGVASVANPQTATLPWTAPTAPRKGVSHAVAASPGTIDDDTRATLLAAIARSKAWADALMDGSMSSFAEIARSEDLAERYVRSLAPLALLSPRIVEAIVEGNVRAGLTLDELTRSMPMAWSEQEHRLWR